MKSLYDPRLICVYILGKDIGLRCLMLDGRCVRRYVAKWTSVTLHLRQSLTGYWDVLDPREIRRSTEQS